jgi:hypothetical protein
MNDDVTTIDNIKKFTDQCFDRDNNKSARIVKGILDARSPRISDISNNMDGNADANYKTIQRFIDKNDTRDAIHRLYNEDSPYVIGDPTDIARPEAKKTEYVGKLKDKKRCFQILVLSFPYKGRAIPFNFITYSSKTINDELSSRNLEHLKVMDELKELLKDKILVLDREFSYEWMFENMVTEDIKFVIRLKVGNNPTVLNENGEKVPLLLNPGDEVYLRGVYYKGNVEVNIAGKWEKGFSEPIWVVSKLQPEEALRIYFLRMKIDESFRDMKNLLNVDKIMNKKQENMEKILSLFLFAYSIGLLIGEEIRESVYSEKKRKLYSGLHILIKRKLDLPKEKIDEIINRASLFFRSILFGDVSTFVFLPKRE